MRVVTICVLKVSKEDIYFDALVTTKGSHLEKKLITSRLIITNSLYEYNEVNPLVPWTLL